MPVDAVGTSSVPRIGLFGGSFNPPHLGHLALARSALQHLGLQQLRWLPAGHPWQKPAADLAPAEHRAAMVERLISGEDRFVLDNRELRRQGASYTADTLDELQTEQTGVQWVLLIGQDQCQRLNTWHRVRDWLPRVSLAVAARDGEPPGLPASLQDLPIDLHALPMPRMDISATAIREKVAAGEAISPLVGEEVARYIDQHALYRGTHRVAPGH